MPRPTINDIAKAAGVSNTAVSFALNGRPGVAEETRERITKIADDLGWTPNAAARALSTSRVNAVGLIITAKFAELAHDTFFLSLIAGVEQALASTPVSLMLKMVEDFDAELDAITRWQRESRVDALVLVNPRPDDPRVELVNSLKIPTVFIGKPDSTAPFTAVHIDNAEAMHSLLTSLADLGATSVFYLHSQQGLTHVQARIDALHNYSDPRITRADSGIIASSTFEQEREQVGRLISRMRTNNAIPDVLICENEELTLAALAAIDDLGLRTPEDIGLVSWESSTGLATRLPRVSTLERSPQLMGEAAIELIMAIYNGEKLKPQVRELSGPQLAIRDTLHHP